MSKSSPTGRQPRVTLTPDYQLTRVIRGVDGGLEATLWNDYTTATGPALWTT
ncbi:MAG: hypothetical protein PVH31_00575 [Ectothiorhodospiraceae bacterium]